MSQNENNKRYFKNALAIQEHLPMFNCHFFPDFGQMAWCHTHQDITWIYETETTVLLKNKSKVIKEICTYNDFYGFMQSANDFDTTIALIKEYELDLDSSMYIEHHTTIKKVPVLEDKNRREWVSDKHFNAISLDTLWRIGTEEDMKDWKQYYSIPFNERFNPESEQLLEAISKRNPFIKPTPIHTFMSFSTKSKMDMDLLEKLKSGDNSADAEMLEHMKSKAVNVVPEEAKMPQHEDIKKLGKKI